MGATTISIKALSIMTLIIIKDTTFSLIELSLQCCYAECHYAEFHYAECRYAEFHYAECRYAECHYSECLGD